MHMFVCSLYVLTEIFTYMHNTRIDGYAYVHGQMCVPVHVCICIYVYKHVYVNVCIYVCVRTGI